MQNSDEMERRLLARLRTFRPQLQDMWATINGHWGYEDAFYRFFHRSFKVYAVQESTEASAKLLRELLPDRPLNAAFERILRDGTRRVFEPSHNVEWERHTRPIIEAFAHARFMVDMANRYSELTEPPRPLPSGYAALLYLFDLR